MFKQTLCALVTAVGLSCSGMANVEQETEPKYETISGIPLSVAESFAQYGGSIAVVLDVAGKKVLAGNSCMYTSLCADAEALILSEIADGDTEKITLTGKYQPNGAFMMITLKMNGHDLNF
ncbi:hypothetical protein HYX13_04915 [Candidatus Woesearchaeota archaeon]|nr:hypothetical protein [Candidatus Woesearchaeota archaeon]